MPPGLLHWPLQPLHPPPKPHSTDAWRSAGCGRTARRCSVLPNRPLTPCPCPPLLCAQVPGRVPGVGGLPDGPGGPRCGRARAAAAATAAPLGASWHARDQLFLGCVPAARVRWGEGIFACGGGELCACHGCVPAAQVWSRMHQVCPRPASALLALQAGARCAGERATGGQVVPGCFEGGPFQLRGDLGGGGWCVNGGGGGGASAPSSSHPSTTR